MGSENFENEKRRDSRKGLPPFLVLALLLLFFNVNIKPEKLPFEDALAPITKHEHGFAWSVLIILGVMAAIMLSARYFKSRR